MKLDPNWGITDGFQIIRKDVQNFVKFILKQLTEINNPTVSACKMLFDFEQQLKIVNDLPAVSRLKLDKSLSSLRMLILEKADIEQDQLLSRLVTYIILVSGLGNPKSLKVFHQFYCMDIKRFQIITLKIYWKLVLTFL